MNAADVHAAVRAALADERPPDPGHLDACPDCRDFAARLATVMSTAPTLGPARPPVPADLTASILDRVRSEQAVAVAHPRPLRRAITRSALSAAAVLALVVGAVTLLPGGTSQSDLSNVLLASAERTAARETARLRVEGVAETSLSRPGRSPSLSSVEFVGTGELVAAEGIHVALTTRHLGDGLQTADYEYVGIGDRAFSRRADGRWDEVAGPSGPVAAVLLDASTSIDLLRSAKRGLVDLGSEGGLRHLRYEVAQAAPLGRPGAVVRVDAWVGDDGLLRRITLTSSGRADEGEATVGWRTVTTMRFFDFGADVTLEPPAGDAVAAGAVAFAVEPAHGWLAD